tara:strand:- start:8995 stop:9216 length:222 start_codon:yes stop_codon:yes gene_type:complete
MNKELDIRLLLAQTSYEFIEWCGLIQGNQKNHPMVKDLYFDFISEYPYYAPMAKMTISRARFYRWLVAYRTFR